MRAQEIFGGRVPVGAEMLWPSDTVPARWLPEEGQLLNIADYPELYKAIGNQFGGDGALTFALQDTRGMFPRVHDNGAGVDPDAAGRADRGDGTAGDAVGTTQGDEFEAHTHAIAPAALSGGTQYMTDIGSNYGGARYGIGTNGGTGSRGGSETRPINFYRKLIIFAGR